MACRPPLPPPPLPGAVIGTVKISLNERLSSSSARPTVRPSIKSVKPRRRAGGRTRGRCRPHPDRSVGRRREREKETGSLDGPSSSPVHLDGRRRLVAPTPKVGTVGTGIIRCQCRSVGRSVSPSVARRPPPPSIEQVSCPSASATLCPSPPAKMADLACGSRSPSIIPVPSPSQCRFKEC